MFARWTAFYLVLAVIVIGLASAYIGMEAVGTKGPNDWGAQAHALQVVRDKLGPGATIQSSNFEFKKDVLHPPCGTYVFHYEFGGQQGKVTSYYDPSEEKFKRDVVGPPGPPNSISP